MNSKIKNLLLLFTAFLLMQGNCEDCLGEGSIRTIIFNATATAATQLALKGEWSVLKYSTNKTVVSCRVGDKFIFDGTGRLEFKDVIPYCSTNISILGTCTVLNQSELELKCGVFQFLKMPYKLANDGNDLILTTDTNNIYLRRVFPFTTKWKLTNRKRIVNNVDKTTSADKAAINSATLEIFDSNDNLEMKEVCKGRTPDSFMFTIKTTTPISKGVKCAINASRVIESETFIYTDLKFTENPKPILEVTYKSGKTVITDTYKK